MRYADCKHPTVYRRTDVQFNILQLPQLAQDNDTSLLDQLARAPWGLPDHEPIPPGSASKARNSQHPRSIDSDRAGHADSPTQGRCYPPPFLNPPKLLQPESVDDALRQLYCSPYDPTSHGHSPAGSNATSGSKSLPVFEEQLAQLQMHLRDHEILQGLLGSSTSAAVHPHAIDGAKLAATAASAAISTTSVTGDRQDVSQQAALQYPAAVVGTNSATWSAPHVPGFGPFGGPGFGSSQRGADVGSSGGRSNTQQGSRAEAPVPMHPGVILSGFAVMVERVVDGIAKLSCTSQEQLTQCPGEQPCLHFIFPFLFDCDRLLYTGTRRREHARHAPGFEQVSADL